MSFQKFDHDQWRRPQLEFVDYFIRNRRNTQHVAEYAQRMERIRQLAPQQEVYWRDEFLDAYVNGHHKDHLKLGYKPKENEEYDPSEIDLAPEWKDATYRKYSKYRVVHGPLPYYLQGFTKDPVIIDTLTTCAVNLMGTSSDDTQQFMNDLALNKEAYKKECLAAIDFLLQIAKSKGAVKLITPAFGVGIYIKQLNFFDQQEATRIMNQAFAEKAKEHEISVDWVIWEQDKKCEQIKQVLEAQTENNPYMKYVIGGLMDHAQQQNTPDQKCVVLNPGSDRTIGGAYYVINPDTLEEQMAQQSEMLLLHSVYNEQMITNFELKLEAQLSPGQQILVRNNALEQLKDLILRHPWEVVFGGKKIEGKRVPTHVAKLYEVCIAENRQGMPEKEFFNAKIMRITSILQQTQHEEIKGFKWFLKKLDFLHLFTRSDDTQKYYNHQYQFYTHYFRPIEKIDNEEKTMNEEQKAGPN